MNRAKSGVPAERVAIALATLAMLVGGCGSTAPSATSGGTASAGGGGTTSATSGGTASVGTSAATGGGASSTGSCNVDPLRTGLTAVQTGVGVDSFDCQVIEQTSKYGEPDAMIFKAIIYVESRFDQTSVACPNLPCGMPSGWTDAESRCYGLMQVVPACGGTPNSVGLLADGHPNLTTDMTAAEWAGSIFNPSVNIAIGIAGVADNRSQVQKQYPGCTVEQYTLMAIGNYNSYGSTKSCTEYNTSYDDLVLTAYRQYAAAAGYAAHAY